MFFKDAYVVMEFTCFSWIHTGLWCSSIIYGCTYGSSVHFFSVINIRILCSRFQKDGYVAMEFKCFSRMHIGIWCSRVIHGCT